MENLFKPLTRDERQDIAIGKWLKSNGKATIVAGTGFGKTYTAIKAIKRVRKKYPKLSVLVLVPTEVLKNQWFEELSRNDVSNVDVQVMNGASKRTYNCDLLIIDEAHRINAKTLSNVFNVVKYKLILGLTATFERLDGMHKILNKYAPVCDTISMQEAMLCGWVAPYKDYVVIIEVPDIAVYKGYNKEFQEHFGFFDFDFNLAMSMLGPKGFIKKKEYCNQICKDPAQWKEVFKMINYHSAGLMRAMQARKKFIYNHPKKLEIAKKIIEHRADKKIITFCANVKMAEAFNDGYVYTGKDSKKKNRMTLNEFALLPSGILHTCKLAEEGLNLPDLSVGIMLGLNSSPTKAVQTLGRVVRLREGKQAEFFTLVLKNTVETEWMKKSRTSDTFEIIDEEALEHVLNNEPYETYKRKIQPLNFRF